MGRYDQKIKTSHSRVWLIVLLILVIVVFWFFLQNKSEKGSGIKTIELPAEKVISGSTTNRVEKMDASPQLDKKQEQRFNQISKVGDKDELFGRELSLVSADLSNWFQVKDSVKKYIVIINDLSQQQVVFKHRSFIKPVGKILVKQDSEGLYLDGMSYRRYDSLANAIAAIDVEQAVRFYLMFKPLFQQVYEEFSYPAEHKLEDVFFKAAASVISAPIIESRIALVPHSIRYKYADVKLEQLNDVKKQMIRMGPENTKKIQNLCRKLVQALLKLSG